MSEILYKYLLCETSNKGGRGNYRGRGNRHHGNDFHQQSRGYRGNRGYRGREGRGGGFNSRRNDDPYMPPPIEGSYF